MANSVQIYCGICEVSQKVGFPQDPTKFFCIHFIISQVFQLTSIDNPMPKPKSYKQFVLPILYHASFFLTAIALSSITVQSIVKALLEFSSTY